MRAERWALHLSLLLATLGLFLGAELLDGSSYFILQREFPILVRIVWRQIGDLGAELLQ